jgi:hypothetical protein
MTITPFDLSRAPFRLDPQADAAQVADELVACFDLASTLSQQLTQATHAAMAAAGIPASDVWFQAAERLASAIDAGVGGGRANAYHNSQHFCEVMLSALYLSMRASLNPRQQVPLLFAALAHDFHHDGTMNKNQAFRLERLAAQAAAPYLYAAGVAADDQAAVTALILATETSVGVPFARECHLQMTRNHTPPAVPSLEPRLQPIAADSMLALQAVLLTEADLLPSVGLTVEYAERTQAKLAAEWGVTLNEKDKLHFLEQVFGDFCVSRFFSPNVQQLKNALRGKAGIIPPSASTNARTRRDKNELDA